MKTFFKIFVLVMMLSILVYATPPVPTQITISNEEGLQNEEQVWVSPTAPDIMIAIWRDFRLGYRQVGIGRSTDYGVTWTGDTLIHPSKQIFARQSDPTLTVGSDGTFYVQHRF